MNNSSNHSRLKEINALKKKLNWGDVPAIYHMVATSIGDLDGILTHGFESGYKNLLKKNTWNMEKLGGYKDDNDNWQVHVKPKISLRHVYNEMGFELHCYPVVGGDRINRNMINDPRCPFKTWIPETMRRLFRVNSFVPFAIFSVQNGDEADIELIKYLYVRVKELINLLEEQFNVIDVRGYNIAEFYQEINRRNGDILSTDIVESSENNEAE